MAITAQSSTGQLRPLLDRSAVLERVGGDYDLLREITVIFLNDYPVLLEEIGGALNARDPKKLERAAHTLKGSVATFEAPTATQAAYRLESIGRCADFSDADLAFAELIAEFDLLYPLLCELIN